MHDRIAKVGFKDGAFQVVIKHEDAHQKKDTVVTCKDDPHPDLHAALAALEPFVREVFLWEPGQYSGRVKVRSVSFSMSEGTDVEGAVISGGVELDADPSGFNWTTPHRPFDQYSEGGNATLWCDEAQAAFRDLRREADAFIKGSKRRQGELFASEGDGTSEPTPIGELTDKVVEVVDGVIQEALSSEEGLVEDLRSRHVRKGFPGPTENVVHFKDGKPVH